MSERKWHPVSIMPEGRPIAVRGKGWEAERVVIEGNSMTATGMKVGCSMGEMYGEPVTPGESIQAGRHDITSWAEIV